MFASPAPAPEMPNGRPTPEHEQLEPDLVEMKPPTTRTMLRGTPNGRSMKIPKMEEKKQSSSA